MKFELLKLNNDLLALDAEHPAPQLLDDQLQMFDLLAAGAQLVDLVGECLAMGIELSLAAIEARPHAKRQEIAVPLDAQ